MIRSAFEYEILTGLSRRQKTLPCKYFYDTAGSLLFDEICKQKEYYLTRSELDILEKNIQEICALCGPECRLVDLGSGSGLKTRLLLSHLKAPAAYIPVDISRDYLFETVQVLHRDYPGLEVLPVYGDFHQLPVLPAPKTPFRKTVFFFPGSTIGNLDPGELVYFLSQIAGLCRPDDFMLVGFDLLKETAELERAYNDRAGATEAFHRNLLKRLNHELGNGFDEAGFHHNAFFNEMHGRIEMHLVSRKRQEVRLNGSEIVLNKNETIHTESSYKFVRKDFQFFAKLGGFHFGQTWTGPDERFMVCSLHPQFGG